MATPAFFLSGRQNRCAGVCGAFHERCDFAFFTHAVAQGDGRSAERTRAGMKVFGKFVAQEKREDHTARLKENNFLILVSGLPAQPVHIKSFCVSKITHAERDGRDSLFHESSAANRK
jgi:hypothetical protein